jgi:type II restriction/modification system DNA methylase subunit YeeA
MTGKNLKYLLAILNSNVSDWYFKQIGTTTGMGTNRWKKYKIELLPIKKVTKTEQKQIEKLVDKIITAKKKDPQTDTTKLESQIDQLVYKLYNLTEEEIKIVENI